MLEKLSNEEKNKINDFMVVYKNYLNPNSNKEIDMIINYIFDSIIKVYLEYKDIVPFISISDDCYNYYILKPVDGKYSLIDYLINTIIQNLDSIELVDDNMNCNYNMLKKKMYINKNNIMALPDSVFDAISKKINKDKYLELYYKNAIYHEIGHMLHYKINNIKAHTIYVPADYLSLCEFPPLKKRMSSNEKKAQIEKRKAIVKARALEKIKNRISMYGVLSDKYNILNPDEINDCSIEVEKPNIKFEEIMLPPFFYLNPIDEAFSECDAQIYSGIFENDIFDMDSSGLECFYLPIDSEHILMTYSPSAYSFSSSIGFALKECISKKSYFRTVFLGKNDLFLEFLGEYDILPVSKLSYRLVSADKGQMNNVQPLLDDIVTFSKDKGISLEYLNIYFPLIYKNNEWVYYTDAIDKIPSKILKK